VRSVAIPFALFVVFGCKDDAGVASHDTGTMDADDDGGGDDDGAPTPVPEIPTVCEGLDAQDVASPDLVIEGADCQEAAIRAAVAQGGTIVIDCPDAPIVLASQLEITTDTVIDGSGTTVLDGGGSTRLFFKPSGPNLWLQNITVQNGRAPEALGDSSVTQANWFHWPGGAILAHGHDDGFAVGGGFYAKNLVCTGSETGSHTRDPMTGQILDTGNGGCLYVFAAEFSCDGCTFSGNRATNGGAIGTLGGKARLSHSSCLDNEARFDASDNDNQGCGGCWCQDGTETAPGEDEENPVHMCGNVFAGNHADADGGAVLLFYRQATHTSFRFEKNLCEHNSAGDAGEVNRGGGCLYVYVDPDTKIPWAPDVGPDTFVVSHNAFLENSAEYLGGGAAIYNIWDTATRFDANLFWRNEVRTTDQQSGGGGGLGLVGTFLELEHNTFAENRAANHTGAIQQGAGGTALTNNLFYRNAAPVPGGSPEPVEAEHLNWVLDEVDDGMNQGFLVYASGGNLYFPSATPSGEPRPTPGAAVLDDPGLGELVREGAFPPYLPLLQGSPAIDAGVPVDPTSDIRGVDRDAMPDIGAVEAD
jgi:hypothetical protein